MALECVTFFFPFSGIFKGSHKTFVYNKTPFPMNPVIYDILISSNPIQHTPTRTP